MHCIRGIASYLKCNLAYFAAKDLTAYQIMPTFREAVVILELTCKLQVVATVSDEASPSRKFNRMHEQMSNFDGSSVVYSTIIVINQVDTFGFLMTRLI